MATPPPSSPQALAGAAPATAVDNAGDGVDAPALNPVDTASLQDTGVKREQKEIKPELADDFLDGWNTENVEKLKKYQAAYARRLKAKYFSNKTLNGDDIFNHETVVDNVIIKSSRWPCTRSFADLIQNMKQNKVPSSIEAESSI